MHLCAGVMEIDGAWSRKKCTLCVIKGSFFTWNRMSDIFMGCTWTACARSQIIHAFEMICAVCVCILMSCSLRRDAQTNASHYLFHSCSQGLRHRAHRHVIIWSKPVKWKRSRHWCMFKCVCAAIFPIIALAAAFGLFIVRAPDESQPPQHNIATAAAQRRVVCRLIKFYYHCALLVRGVITWALLFSLIVCDGLKLFCNLNNVRLCMQLTRPWHQVIFTDWFFKAIHHSLEKLSYNVSSFFKYFKNSALRNWKEFF
jgi:hypothetical protein